MIGLNKHDKIPFRWNVYGPVGLVENHDWQFDQLVKVKAWIEASQYNPLHLAHGRFGVVACGIGAAYVEEALRELGLLDSVNYWKVTVVYPLVENQARKFLKACDRVLVIEEGTPLFENQMRIFAQVEGILITFVGKGFCQPFPQTGELTRDGVYQAVEFFPAFQLTPLHIQLLNRLKKPRFLALLHYVQAINI